MNRPILLTVGIACACAATASACGDDDSTTTTTPDAGVVNPPQPPPPPPPPPPPGDGGPSDAGVDAALVDRGRYLVDHVMACSDCHTPRLDGGAPDMAKYLSGVVCFADLNGPADGGCVHSRNLTNDPTGLQPYSDDQVKAMFLDGKLPDGGNLVPVMPYFVFHDLTPSDADAVLAYLRTVPAVMHALPANDPPFDALPAPAQPIDPTTIPPVSDAGVDGGGDAGNGRYLASLVCIDCHTPSAPMGSPRPIDMTRPFAGGQEFQVGPFTITSKNLTSDPTGLGGTWTVADVVRALKQGKDDMDAGICPPMPSGPMGAFGGLTDDDARDIATYVLGLPPITNATPENVCGP